MSALTATHGVLLAALVASCVLALVQLLAADLIGLRAGHTPGHPVAADHDNLHFRSVRAIANLNESFAIFVGLTVVAMAASADPFWSGAFAWLYLLGRIGHGVCYYADWRTPRSICFGLAIVGLVLLAGLVVVSLW